MRCHGSRIYSESPLIPFGSTRRMSWVKTGGFLSKLWSWSTGVLTSACQGWVTRITWYTAHTFYCEGDTGIRPQFRSCSLFPAILFILALCQIIINKVISMINKNSIIIQMFFKSIYKMVKCEKITDYQICQDCFDCNILISTWSQFGPDLIHFVFYSKWTGIINILEESHSKVWVNIMQRF